MDINRIRWAARRGMLELDLILQPFIEQRYAALSEGDQRAFQELLLCEDQDLFAWFLHREIPDSDALIPIVEMVRHHAQNPA